MWPSYDKKIYVNHIPKYVSRRSKCFDIPPTYNKESSFLFSKALGQLGVKQKWLDNVDISLNEFNDLIEAGCKIALHTKGLFKRKKKAPKKQWFDDNLQSYYIILWVPLRALETFNRKSVGQTDPFRIIDPLQWPWTCRESHNNIL